MRSQHLRLPTRPTWRIAVVAIVCLAAGMAIGWLIRAHHDGAGAGATAIKQAGAADSPPTTSRAEPVPRLPSLTKLDRPLVQHVVLISIDGLRPDLLLRAKTPSLRSLLDRSAFSLWAQTVEHPYVYTLPAHVTMLTGVNPDRHGVTWNDYIEWFPEVPTVFELAKSAPTGGGGRPAQPLTTAMATGKMKFVAVNRPGSIDWVYLPPDEPVDDLLVAAEAEKILRQHRPNLLFVHLPGVDTVGHASGWGSPEQLQAVEQVDAAVGQVLSCVTDLKLDDSTLVIVTADHGGAGLTHWGDDPRSRTIPWIARGPGVRRGYDLTLLPGLDIRTADTFATVCVALGIPLPPDTEGRFVQEMLEVGPRGGQELLREKK